ncbi:hypothetical protein NYO67_5498 [Aspergillus flavus]|nr:hypothetical protein NYO67_5498 [Aspergillus flavus]
MEILPIEIKWHICRFVKANPFGIIAPLSLTSRAWYDATAPILYETLIVRFGDSATLQKAVFELEEGRRGRLFLKHARRLDIAVDLGRKRCWKWQVLLIFHGSGH